MRRPVAPRDYYRAAVEVLSTLGYAGLKQAELCRHLGVTTGSFYTHFESWADFKGSFLETWLEERTVQLVASASAESTPQRSLEVLVDFACALPHRAEAAIRAWSHRDPEVALTQATVDAQRLEAVRAATTELLGPDEAEHFARLGMFVLMGFQQSDAGPSTQELRWSLERVYADLIASAERSSPRV